MPRHIITPRRPNEPLTDGDIARLAKVTTAPNATQILTLLGPTRLIRRLTTDLTAARTALADINVIFDNPESHRPVTRYSYDDGESSAATEEEARKEIKFMDWSMEENGPELHTFEVCATCGPAEMLFRDEYRDSQWPCQLERRRLRKLEAAS